MKTIVFRPDLSTDERVKELKKVCKTKTVKAFKRSLTESDIEKELRVYADLGIKLQEAELEKSEIVKTHNEGIKAIEAEMDVSLDVIKNGKKEVSDDLYLVPNYDSGQMETFDKFGELIETRGLTPDEHTGHLFNNDGSEKENAAPIEDNGVKEIGFEEPVKESDIQDADWEPIDETATDPEIVDGDAPENDETVNEGEKKPKKPRKTKTDTDTSK